MEVWPRRNGDRFSIFYKNQKETVKQVRKPFLRPTSRATQFGRKPSYKQSQVGWGKVKVIVKTE